MGVISFKAYYLEYLSVEEGTTDERGNYVPGKQEWLPVGKCDAVPAGRNNTITTSDGKVDTFSYQITNLPTNCREFKAGECIRLTFQDKETIPLVVKGFARYQLQSKIWA